MLIIFGFLFLVFFFSLFSLLKIGGGVLLFLVDPPAISLIIISLLFFLYVSKNGGVIGKYIKNSFKKNYAYTKAELTSLSIALKSTIKFLLGIGGLGCFVGITFVFRYLERKEYLGPSLAITLFTLIYVFAISFFVFYPTQAWAENRLNALDD